MDDGLDRDIRWAARQMPRVARALDALPPLDGVRLAVNLDLDVKGVPVVAAQLSANRSTRQNEPPDAAPPTGFEPVRPP